MEEFGNYLLETDGFLGQGAFGLVERVKVYNKSKTHCTLFAKKSFKPEPNFDSELIGELKQRFKREIKSQSLCKHNNVVPIYLHNLSIEEPWFIMELADISLQEELEQNALNKKQKLSALLMILEGIKYIHNKGLIHRDIKPLNMLKFTDGSYKISDFGLVKNLEQDSLLKTQFGTVMGTSKYLAPEISNGSTEYTILSDIYAIGVVIDDLNLGNEVNFIIDKCMHRRPNARYKNVQEIINDLNSLPGENND